MINSKQKGNDFELKIAKMLSKWAQEDFHRTPGSGALHWKNDTRVVSDIVPCQHLVDSGWPLSIECKKVEYPWEFSAFMEGTAQFWKHWQQAEDDANSEHMIPLLVFSKNRRDVFTAMQLVVYNHLGINGIDTIHMSCNNHELVIMRLSDLLEAVTCDQILNANLLSIVDKQPSTD